MAQLLKEGTANHTMPARLSTLSILFLLYAFKLSQLSRIQPPVPIYPHAPSSKYQDYTVPPCNQGIHHDHRETLRLFFFFGQEP